MFFLPKILSKMYFLVKIKSAHDMRFSILKIYSPSLTSTMAYKGKTDTKIKYLGDEKKYLDEKNIFHIFETLSNRKQYKNNRHKF